MSPPSSSHLKLSNPRSLSYQLSLSSRCCYLTFLRLSLTASFFFLLHFCTRAGLFSWDFSTWSLFLSLFFFFFSLGLLVELFACYLEFLPRTFPFFTPSHSFFSPSTFFLSIFPFFKLGLFLLGVFNSNENFQFIQCRY